MDVRKKKGFTMEALKPRCPDGYKHIKIKSGKKFTIYITATAMAISRGEGKGICLDAAGLALRNLALAMSFINKKRDVFGRLRLKKIYIDHGVREIAREDKLMRKETFGRMMAVYEIT